MNERIALQAKIKAALATAKPAELVQIRSFVAANATTSGCRYWFLTPCKNLDNGRTFLTAGSLPNKPGVTRAKLVELLAAVG